MTHQYKYVSLNTRTTEGILDNLGPTIRPHFGILGPLSMISTIMLFFLQKTLLYQTYPKYDIVRKEFGK